MNTTEARARFNKIIMASDNLERVLGMQFYVRKFKIEENNDVYVGGRVWLLRQFD